MSLPKPRDNFGMFDRRVQTEFGMVLARLKTRARESQSDIAAIKAYQLEMKETIARGEE